MIEACPPLPRGPPPVTPTDTSQPIPPLYVRPNGARFLFWAMMALAAGVAVIWFSILLLDPAYHIDTGRGRFLNDIPPLIRPPIFFVSGVLFVLLSALWVRKSLLDVAAILSAEDVQVLAPLGWKRWRWAEVERLEFLSSNVIPEVTIVGHTPRRTPLWGIRDAAAIPVRPASDASLETVLAYIARFRPDLIPDRLRTKAGLS